MLKIRLIPTLLLQNGRMVKGVQFDNYRDTGHPVKASKVYNDQYVDELIFIDIDANKTGLSTAFDIIKEVSEEVFMPFTIGGGIRTLDDIGNALNAGADKVAITTAAYENPDFIKQASRIYGRQCIVVGIDVKDNEVYTKSGSFNTHENPVDYAKKMEKLGAGELLVHAIDRDGMRNGYNIELTKEIASVVTIPIIALGGAGRLDDFKEVLTDGKAQAASASSIFHFTDQSPIKVRSYLKSNGFLVRAR